MLNARHLPAGRQEIPNHKSQNPFLGVWDLGFDWELGFGHWGFIF